MCVSLPDSGHRALRVFLQGQGGVKGAGRADGVQCVGLWMFSPCSVFAGVLVGVAGEQEELMLSLLRCF